MRVFHQLDEIRPLLKSTSVAIGNFDGCHLGHVALLEGALAHARHEGSSPAVLTFYPHPVEVLKPGNRRERLMTTSEKLAALEKLGVEYVLVAPFDEKLASREPTDFFEHFLVEGLKAKSVHVGFNFHFGKNRLGDTTLLKSLCDSHGISLNVMEPFQLNGVRVSSSTIRELIRQGDCLAAAKFLGRPYSVAGQVSHGDNRGHTLGFPTANLHHAEEKLLPANGVYVTQARWQKQPFRSVTNIGVRPTFHAGETKATVEVHVIDFAARLYDEFVQIDFYERIRGETKFPNVEALKTQIEKDVNFARTSRSF